MTAREKWLKTDMSSLRDGYSPKGDVAERQVPRGGSATVVHGVPGRFVETYADRRHGEPPAKHKK